MSSQSRETRLRRRTEKEKKSSSASFLLPNVSLLSVIFLFLSSSFSPSFFLFLRFGITVVFFLVPHLVPHLVLHLPVLLLSHHPLGMNVCVRKEANVMIELQKTWRGHRQNQRETKKKKIGSKKTRRRI